MTHALDVNERISQLDRAAPVSAPVTKAAAASDSFGTFAITFAIAFAILYTLLERQNWPLITYHPAVGKVDFWMHAARSGEGPPMYWYGWVILAVPAALLIGWAATLVPRLRVQQATFFCCVLAIVWPIAYLLAASTVDPESFKESIATWTGLAGIPAVAAAALLTWVAGPRGAQRMWTSWVLIMPIAGLIILGWSLNTYFLR
ncbi:MAG TPA: hypothetical protein VH684_29335 [Xanthobacteraceae bacterium]|jgi:hypothetical protein